MKEQLFWKNSLFWEGCSLSFFFSYLLSACIGSLFLASAPVSDDVVSSVPIPGPLWLWHESCEDCHLNSWQPQKRESYYGWGKCASASHCCHIREAGSLKFWILNLCRSWSACGLSGMPTYPNSCRMTSSSSGVLSQIYFPRSKKSLLIMVSWKKPFANPVSKRIWRMSMVRGKALHELPLGLGC